MAVAAAYAMAVHRDAIHRVAIVDIDVHHGNGTEDIIRNLSPRKISSVTRTPAGVMHVTQDVYSPWKDELDSKNVQFISIHGFGSRDDTEHHATFYPGTGAAEDNTSQQASARPAAQARVHCALDCVAKLTRAHRAQAASSTYPSLEASTLTIGGWP